MCTQVVPAVQNEDVPVPVVVCCAQAGSVGKQSMGKREKQHCDVTGSDSERCYRGDVTCFGKESLAFFCDVL